MYLLSLSGTIINSRSHPLKTHKHNTKKKKFQEKTRKGKEEKEPD
jgi:hypothetical protein